MHVRASRSDQHTYLHLVNSFRDDKGRVRQRQIAQLRRFDEISDDQVGRLVVSLLRATDNAVDSVESDFSFSAAAEVGGPWLFLQVLEKSGIVEALTRARQGNSNCLNSFGAGRLASSHLIALFFLAIKPPFALPALRVGTSRRICSVWLH